MHREDRKLASRIFELYEVDFIGGCLFRKTFQGSRKIGEQAGTMRPGPSINM